MVKKIFLFFFFSFLLISQSFATTLTNNDWNSFINACNSYYGVSTSPIEASGYTFLVYTYFSPTSIYVNCSGSISNGSKINKSSNSETYSVVNNDGSNAKTWRFYYWDGKKWTYSGNMSGFKNASYYTPYTSSPMVILDGLPLTGARTHYFIYSLVNGTITQKLSTEVSTLQNDVSVLQNDVSVLQNDVTNINNGLSGTSEQLDIIIDNQNKLYEDTSQSSDGFLSSFPKVEMNDPTNATFENIATGITSAFSSTSPVSVNFTFNGNSYSISSDDIAVKDDTILNFLSILCNFTLSMFLIKDLRREIQKIQEGKIESVGSEDVSANMV